jgi:hypothetical protein
VRQLEGQGRLVRVVLVVIVVALVLNSGGCRRLEYGTPKDSRTPFGIS